MNFGQDSSFAGNKTPQGNTDDNGVGDFFYAPPSGFLALAAQNLPTPAIDPAQDDVPADYFNTVLWTGDGSARSISVGWQPDFLWTKSRSTVEAHRLHDAVRGGNGTVLYELNSNETSAEGTDTLVNAFEADGFAISAGANSPNVSGRTYVGWSWLAGNGTSSNTDGSITSTVSVNEKAKFSIITFTNPSSNGNFTVGHGLGVAPAVIIAKERTYVGNNWHVWHKYFGSSNNSTFLHLNETNASVSVSGLWGAAASTSTVVGGYSATSGPRLFNNSQDSVLYCFAEVEGYSKFGSFVGNDDPDGPFVYLGFLPSLLILKNASAAQPWVMIDNTRSSYNVAANKLYPNSDAAENSTSTDNSIDFLSNGFKPRGAAASNDATNGASNTIIYMAFAENPFKYANAR
jgi:hypothetical protein